MTRVFLQSVLYEPPSNGLIFIKQLCRSVLETR
jgi:hypothetical protein